MWWWSSSLDGMQLMSPGKFQGNEKQHKYSKQGMLFIVKGLSSPVHLRADRENYNHSDGQHWTHGQLKLFSLTPRFQMRKYYFIRWPVSDSFVFSLDVSLYSTHAENSAFETTWLCVLSDQRASPSEIIINYLFKARWNISLFSVSYLTFLTVVK